MILAIYVTNLQKILDTSDMKTKIVYVLVSQEADYYYEMTLLSLYSLRLHHPKDIVQIVMDEDTHQRLIAMESSILCDAIPIVVSIPPEYTTKQRSRYLKTRLTEIIEGDFLYLDVDTLVNNSLDDIDREQSDIAFALDGGCKSWAMEISKKAGFSLYNQPIYNGGVFYVKHSDIACNFFSVWHNFWRQSLKNGVSEDQPALWQTNTFLGFPVHELDGSWNCVKKYQPFLQYLNNAHIIHYLTTLPDKPIGSRLLLKSIKKRGKLGHFATYVAKHPSTIGYLVFTKLNDISVSYVSTKSFNDSLPIPLRLFVSTYPFLWWLKQKTVKIMNYIMGRKL